MAKRTGHGATLKVDDDSNGSFTTIGDVKQIGGPKIMREKINATTLDSTLVIYIPGDPKEIGDVPFVICYDPNSTTHQTIRSLIDANTTCPWQLVMANYSTTKTWAFSGFVQNFEVGEMTSNSLVEATITITPTTDFSVS